MFNIYDPTRFLLIENPQYIKRESFTLRVTLSFIYQVTTQFNHDRIGYAD
jgi:hypothetical protein